jgi:capsular exopolysaccharide synthesis family protein
MHGEVQPETTPGALPSQAADAAGNAFGFLNQHKFVLVSCLVLGAAAGTLFAFKKQAIYEARAKLHIDKREAPGSRGLDFSGTGSTFGYDYITTQIEVLASMELLRGAVDKHLITVNEQGNLESKAVSLQDMIGVRPNRPEERNQAVSTIVGEVRQLLAVRQVIRDNKPTQMLDLSMRATSPEDARLILDAVVRAYQEYQKSLQKSSVLEALQLLNKDRDRLNSQMELKKQEIDRMVQENQLIGTGADSVGYGSVGTLEASLVQLEVAIIDANAFLTSVKALAVKNDPELLINFINTTTTARGLSPGVLGRSPVDPTKIVEITNAIQEEEDGLQALQLELGEKHVRVREALRRLEALKKKASGLTDLDQKIRESLVRNAVDAAEQRVRELNSKKADIELQYKKAKNQAFSLSRAFAQYDIKLQEYKTLRLNLEAVIASIEKINVVQEFDALRVNIADPVQPNPVPVEPNHVRIAAMGGAIGTGLGLAIAYLISLVDNSIRNPEELQELTGAPVLGVVPLIDNRRGIDYPTGGRWVETHSRSTEAEAYRTVRTAVHFGHRTRNAKVLLVTSPTQGDGKSTTTANLAASMAMNGMKVLLVEADLRRPVQHQVYELNPDFGLTSALTGHAAVEDVIVRTPVANLDVAPAGPVPPNPTELLNSPSFDEFLKRARETYDRILIDSPPTLVVADACVLAPRADGVILVVNSDRATKRGVTETARTLLSVGSRIAGIIVNMVDPREQRYYQYYYYGGYYYNYYGRREDRPGGRGGSGGTPPGAPGSRSVGNGAAGNGAAGNGAPGNGASALSSATQNAIPVAEEEPPAGDGGRS